MTPALEWFKSSYSSNDGPQCVEVALAGTAVHVRDSKTPHTARLSFADASWAGFLGLIGGHAD
ncbi:DUF397 domain-containing protein [Streptomyces sp. NPDC052077]|uniref:DUF397 domain-containing protein n=1 Tax=Streptomyces sp. NPDC052077 TaxID=3154757 RepID=UPI0034353A34